MDELIGQFKKKMTALIGQKEKNMKKLRLSLVNWIRDDSSHWIFDKKMTALLSYWSIEKENDSSHRTIR